MTNTSHHLVFVDDPVEIVGTTTLRQAERLLGLTLKHNLVEEDPDSSRVCESLHETSRCN